MISASIRNLAGFAFWVLIAVITLYTTVQVTLANYIGTRTSLELQGWEPQPLSTDPLVGQMFGAFLPDATLAQLVALGMALTASLGFFVLASTGSHIYELNEIRVETPSRSEKARAFRLMVFWGGFGFAILIPLIGVVVWDLDLFSFRTVADAFANGEPQVAPLVYPSLSEFLGAHDRQYIDELIRIGPRGYLSITVLSCVLLEIALWQLRDRWTRLMQPIDDVFDPVAAAGFDDEPGDGAAEADVEPEADEGPGAAERNGHRPYRGNGTPGDADPLFNSPHEPINADQWPDTIGDAPQESVSERDVNGRPGIRVTLADAVADRANYHVDPSGRVWDRGLWDELHQQQAGDGNQI